MSAHRRFPLVWPFRWQSKSPSPTDTSPAGALVEITPVLSGHTGSDHNRSNINIDFWHAQGHRAVSFGRNCADAWGTTRRATLTRRTGIFSWTHGERSRLPADASLTQLLGFLV